MYSQPQQHGHMIKKHKVARHSNPSTENSRATIQMHRAIIPVLNQRIAEIQTSLFRGISIFPQIVQPLQNLKRNFLLQLQRQLPSPLLFPRECLAQLLHLLAVPDTKTQCIKSFRITASMKHLNKLNPRHKSSVEQLYRFNELDGLGRAANPDRLLHPPHLLPGIPQLPT